MAIQMQKVISNCKQCIQHDGAQAKMSMQPIIATAPLELLHVDFRNIETTMELDQSSNVASVLVFCNHFTKHVMAEDCCYVSMARIHLNLWSTSQAPE